MATNNAYFYDNTDDEEELFLSEVPISLLQHSIETQFDDPLENRKRDYIQSFINKYEFSKENMLDDDLEMLELSRDEFLKFIENIFSDYLNVGFTNLDDMSEDDQHEIVHLTYRFFIKNIKRNFVNIVINYINDNKDGIMSNFTKKKDVTTAAFKTEIDSEYEIIVLGNLGDIIDFIFKDLIEKSDIDIFLELCKDEEYILELEYVKNKFDEFELTGNFIEKYISMIDDEFKIEIQSKVRNHILRKYPKRKKKEVDLAEYFNDDSFKEDDTEENEEETKNTTKEENTEEIENKK